MNIRRVTFDHPDAVKLNDQVQAEYAVRYGDEGDVTPLDPSMFEPPLGLYLMAYDAQERPVATGGWRTQDENDEGYSDGDAELKRMYVIEEARGNGLARRILAALEDDARAAGRTPHGPGDRQQAARGHRPLRLQRLRAVRQVRPLPLPRGQPLLREASVRTPARRGRGH
jgi:GNAT superfamily N-acetyltransferase